MHSFLKVKIKSLAAEARIIRHEERRVSRRQAWAEERQDEAAKWSAFSERYKLHEHRTKDVRNEARSALLAYGYLRGRTYRAVEPVGQPAAIILKRVADLIIKYGRVSKDEAPDRLKAWIEGIEYVPAPKPDPAPKGLLSVFRKTA